IAGPPAAAPAIAMNTASGILSGVSIIASTATALKALGGGGGGLSGGAKGAPAPTSAAPKVEFQASSENQIGNTLANNVNEQPPVQAYVVESEVTTAQSLANNRITSNSI